MASSRAAPAAVQGPDDGAVVEALEQQLELGHGVDSRRLLEVYACASHHVTRSLRAVATQLIALSDAGRPERAQGRGAAK
ncbi:MAG: hypothetical protein ACI9U2_000551 [Bradymonadia bacterium]|jgi:hypothetical protein